MSLKIAESECHRMEQSTASYKPVTEKIALIKNRLSQDGWTYPHTSEACPYSENIKETWKELEDVIATIRSITSKQTSHFIHEQ